MSSVLAPHKAGQGLAATGARLEQHMEGVTVWPLSSGVKMKELAKKN